MSWILAQKAEPCEIKPDEKTKHERETAVPEVRQRNRSQSSWSLRWFETGGSDALLWAHWLTTLRAVKEPLWGRDCLI